MFQIIQLIYVIDGQEEVFQEFESLAIPIISRYNGRLTLRIRPTDVSVIEGIMEKPYEIHFVEFDSEVDFERFKLDEERKQFLHLKEQSIRSSVLIAGKKL